ncbi:sce7725 family protein [Adlercreutzia murintestinalis]|uniref:sce7725 family protein n=1 Tax=Adlercreutzia murintestinalis TaxID=2941325 RepID=UPI00203AC42E|nr:sce7725 family protein [Adlercreutzia murintestinalis]
MYFPFLRGRQNELLAIRELQSKGRLSRVTPIIEPVKASSTLLSVLEQFRQDEKEIILVCSPTVGSFEKELNQDFEYRDKFNNVIANSMNLVNLYLCGQGLDDAEVFMVAHDDASRAYLLTADNRRIYEKACDRVFPRYTLVSDSKQRIRRKARGDRITLESAFKPQPRNIDYRAHEDDFLTEELFYYSQDGFCGFSDFSVIGEEYNEGGFLPKVVALHLVYLNEENEQLRIRHFTSSDNVIGSDIGRKYHDALGSLLKWAEKNASLLRPTCALEEMNEIFKAERFPGLGVAKKLAIMHHLEMVNILLEERK